MKSRNLMILAAVVLFSVSVLSTSPTVSADDLEFRAKLNGYQEVPSVSTLGSGSFRAKVSGNGTQLNYILKYKNLDTVTQAHIHFAQTRNNGSVMVFLCSNISNPTGNVPLCSDEGEVRGTLTATDVLGPTTHGIDAGEFDEFIRALRVGAGYVNVHTSEFPGGEIRGQVKRD